MLCVVAHSIADVCEVSVDAAACWKPVRCERGRMNLGSRRTVCVQWVMGAARRHAAVLRSASACGQNLTRHGGETSMPSECVSLTDTQNGASCALQNTHATSGPCTRSHYVPEPHTDKCRREHRTTDQRATPLTEWKSWRKSTRLLESTQWSPTAWE